MTTRLTAVSVIICTFSKDRSRQVMHCIDILKKGTLRPSEILLVLDPDEQLQLFYESVLPSDVLVLSSEKPGLSNARNTGARRAREDIVAFIDDDAIPDLNWLRKMLRHYEDENVIAVAGRAIPIWEVGRPKWFPEELEWVVGCTYRGLPEKTCTVRNPIGSNMSFRADVFRQIGYFSIGFGRIGKKLLGSEEAEFSIRALSRIPRSKIVYDPSSIVYHNVPKTRATLKYMMKRSFYEGLSKASFGRLQYNPSNPLSREKEYLSYLLRRSLPQRVRTFHHFQDLSQLLAILLSTLLVFAGYISGRIYSSESC